MKLVLQFLSCIQRARQGQDRTGQETPEENKTRTGQEKPEKKQDNIIDNFPSCGITLVDKNKIQEENKQGSDMKQVKNKT